MAKSLITHNTFIIKETIGLEASAAREKLSSSIQNNGGSLIVTGVLQRAEAKNQNGRVYPKAILEREIDKYITTEIAQNRAYGELDHPDSSIVNLRNVSHVIRKIWWEGNDVVGEVEILNTPAGNILKELVLAGLTIGISSRGMGSVNQISEDTTQVQSDFNLVCWDFVSNPSTHEAFLSPVNESVTDNKEIIKEQHISKLLQDIVCELSGVCCIQ